MKYYALAINRRSRVIFMTVFGFLIGLSTAHAQGTLGAISNAVKAAQMVGAAAKTANTIGATANAFGTIGATANAFNFTENAPKVVVFPCTPWPECDPKAFRYPVLPNLNQGVQTGIDALYRLSAGSRILDAKHKFERLEYERVDPNDEKATFRKKIKGIQITLYGKGYDVTATGELDRATRQAITDYQQNNGIQPTGRVTKETAKMLADEKKDIMATFK